MQKKSTSPQDGPPTGPNTPEGAACDMVRALMYHDRARLLEICLPPQRTSSLGTYIKFYYYFLNSESGRTLGIGKGPEEMKVIRKVFEARSLSDPGPRTLATKEMGWADIKFVDVVVTLNNGKQETKRTLVVAVRKNLWFAHPIPNTSPQLSAGLEAESLSRKEWRRL